MRSLTICSGKSIESLTQPGRLPSTRKRCKLTKVDQGSVELLAVLPEVPLSVVDEDVKEEAVVSNLLVEVDCGPWVKDMLLEVNHVAVELLAPVPDVHLDADDEY
eukprot:2149592-Amphidinium_carterae.1